MIVRHIPVALVATGLAISAAAADPRGEALIRQFIDDIDALPHWQADAATIRSEAESGDTIVETLRFEADNGQEFTIAYARFRGLAEAADGGIAADQIEWRDAAYDSDLFELDLPALAARDLELPDPATLVIDPAEPIRSAATFYTAWTKARIAAAQVPTASIVQTTPGPGEAKPLIARSTYNDVRLTGLEGGTIASLEIGPITTSTEGAAESRFDIGVSKLETINFGSLAHVLDERNYRGGFGDGIWRPVVGQAIHSDMSGAATDGTLFTIAEAAFQNIEARQPAQPFTERLDALPQDADSAGKEARRLALSTLNDMFSAFRLGSATVRDVKVQPSEAADAAAGVSSIALKALSLDGFENLSVQNISVEAPEGFARVASIDVADFRFPEFEAFSRLFELSEPGSDTKARNDAIRAMLSALPRFTRASLAGAAGGLAGQDPVSLDRVDVSTEKYVGPFPTVTRLALEGLTVPGAILRMEPQAARMLDRFGYDDLTFGMELQEIWMPSETRSLTNVTMDVEDAVTVALAYTYTGIDEDWIVSSIARAADVTDKSDTAAMMAGLEGLHLEAATLKVTDRSLTDRLLGYLAERQGLTVDGATYRQQLRGALPFLLSTIVPGKVAGLLMTPLQDFLGGGKTLVLEASPAEPVPVVDLAETAESDPIALIDLLGAKASTQAAP